MIRLGHKDQRFFIFDYETTGTDTDKCRILEIGIIVCNENFELMETFESLVCHDAGDMQLNWNHDELSAYKIHGIKPLDLSHGMTLQEIRSTIENLAMKHTKNTVKPIIVSDNIQFEWALTARILPPIRGYFHYCGWDTSLFLDATGVGDPPTPPHRALKDCGLLHAAILKALDRTRNLR